MKMKSIQLPILLTVSLLLIAFPVFGKNLHPLDDPAINFQGRIEVGEIGYTGWSKFTFAIGDEDFVTEYWSSWAETTCVEGIYNIILGRDTNDPLTDAVFNHIDAYYLRVAFSTDGSHFETLSPDQEIVTVPFAVNADLLDGMESPDSAFVGVTDSQTIYDKTFVDTHYFAFIPGQALPADPARGVFAWDSDTGQMVYGNGLAWVGWGEGTSSISGSGVDNYLTFWTGPQTISGDSSLMYEETYHLTLTSDATSGSAFKIVADSVTDGKALEITSIGGGGTSDPFVYIDRAGTGRAMEVQSGTTTGTGVWIASDTVTSGRTMTVKSNSAAMTAGGVAMAIEQDQKDGLGRALFVKQDGPGEAARFTLSSPTAEGSVLGGAAIRIEANRNTEPTLDATTGGGALHVQNSLNTGPAITAYSNQTAPLAPVVWFDVGDGFQDQPVMALDGRTGAVSPLRLVPLTTLPDEDTYNVQTGELFARKDGTFHFFNGTDWIALTGADGGGSPGGVDTYVQYNDGGSFGGNANLQFDGTDTLTADKFTTGDGSTIDAIRDEDNMTSDDPDALATQQSIKAYVDTEVAGAVAARWVEQSFTRADDEQFAADTDFPAGTPIRYSDALDYWRYGMIVDCSSGTITLEGHTLDVACDTLQTGNPEMLRQVNLLAMGNLSFGDNWGPPNAWQLRESYIVRATAKLEQPAGTTEAWIAIGVGAVGDDLLSSPVYINLANSADEVSSGININAANYNIQFGEKIYVNIDKTGDATNPGTDLLVTLDVVNP
jgi:hypothetical protein